MDFSARRAEMVETQLRGRGIHDQRVLAAMGDVPREEFLPPPLRARAYADSALPIEEGQTISQPWIVAAICQALELRGAEVVLEVGTGSGYSAAVLARLARQVISIERYDSLARPARGALEALGVDNVSVLVGDGTQGLAERAPFEAIAVHATAPAPPATLLGQLGEGGRLVVPIAATEADVLSVYRLESGKFSSYAIAPCRFVPLIGDEGFDPSS